MSLYCVAYGYHNHSCDKIGSMLEKGKKEW